MSHLGNRSFQSCVMRRDSERNGWEVIVFTNDSLNTLGERAIPFPCGNVEIKDFEWIVKIKQW